jgi:hypothetical protein
MDKRTRTTIQVLGWVLALAGIGELLFLSPPWNGWSAGKWIGFAAIAAGITFFAYIQLRERRRRKPKVSNPDLPSL